MKKIYTLAMSMLTVLILSSCATGVQKGSAVYESEDSIFAEVRSSGEVLIYSSLLPGLEIYGEVLQKESNTVSITRVEMLGNWPNGWTSGRYEATGIYTLTPAPEGYRIECKEPLTLWEIEEGEIRYNDTYFLDDEGLYKVRHRVERIRETARFLKEEKNFSPLSLSLKKGGKGIMPFTHIQGKFLFPEIYGGKEHDPGFFKEGIVWDEEYTKKEFPDHLQELRNSGSLWRDFEEAPQLFFSLYNLDYFFGTYIENITLEKRG